MDFPIVDRRTDARFALPQASITRATLRPGCAVNVIDLSAGGALVQAAQPLRPGARVHFQLETATRAFALVARVVRCAVWMLDAQQGATYRGALKFDDRCESFGEAATPYGSHLPWSAAGDGRQAGHGIPRTDDRARRSRSTGAK